MNRVARLAMATLPLTVLALAFSAVSATAAGDPPRIAKAFGADSIPLNGAISLAITITNRSSNAVPELGVSFFDTPPPGLTVAATPGLTNTCGGTPTATGGGPSVSLAGGTIAVNSTCSVTVIVTGT